MGSKGRKNVKKAKQDKEKNKYYEISIMGFPNNCYYNSN